MAADSGCFEVNFEDSPLSLRLSSRLSSQRNAHDNSIPLQYSVLVTLRYSNLDTSSCMATGVWPWLFVIPKFSVNAGDMVCYPDLQHSG